MELRSFFVQDFVFHSDISIQKGYTYKARSCNTILKNWCRLLQDRNTCSFLYSKNSSVFECRLLSHFYDFES
uniref:Uncharacterized protein n=1 Tax=Arundo donax TaxID=35708 RepID=A0A0A9F9G8_ARUDO